MIPALIVSDLRLYREGIARAVLEHAPDSPVCQAVDLVEAVAAAAVLEHGVALVDMRLEEADRVIRAIRDVSALFVLALGVGNRDEDVIVAAEAGVSGYVTRQQSLDELIAAMRVAASGEAPCTPRVAAALMRRVRSAGDELAAANGPLTPREHEILTLLERGLSNKEIASALNVEVATVKNHVHAVLRKLGVPTRGVAAAMARSGRVRSGR